MRTLRDLLAPAGRKCSVQSRAIDAKIGGHTGFEIPEAMRWRAVLTGSEVGARSAAILARRLGDADALGLALGATSRPDAARMDARPRLVGQEPRTGAYSGLKTRQVVVVHNALRPPVVIRPGVEREEMARVSLARDTLDAAVADELTQRSS